MGKGTTDRGGRTDTRQRRALQRLGNDPFGTLGIEAGDGVVLDPALGTISVGLATDPGLAFSSGDLIVIVGNGLELTVVGIEIDLAANGGLAFSSGDLILDLRDTTPALELTANGLGVIVGAGLELTATGVEIDLLASGGLTFSSGDLTVDLRDTTPALELTANGIGVIVGNGLELTATGIEIDLAADSVLAFSSGDLTVVIGAGIETSDGIGVDFAADPGLEFSSGGIRVKIKSAGGIARGSDGLSTTKILDSGSFTPTLTHSVNIDSSAAHEGVWSRVGDIVTVYLRVDVTATSTGTNTDLFISLPVAPNSSFPGSTQANGIGGSHSDPDDGLVCIITSKSGTQTVLLRYRPSIAGIKRFRLSFSYSVDQPD